MVHSVKIAKNEKNLVKIAKFSQNSKIQSKKSKIKSKQQKMTKMVHSVKIGENDKNGSFRDVFRTKNDIMWE